MTGRLPARSRRGLSLFEATATIALAAVLAAALAELGGRAFRAAVTQEDARIVSIAADGAALAAEAELEAEIAWTRAAAANARIVPLSRIEAALSGRLPAATPSGRGILFAYYSPSPERLHVAAWAGGGDWGAPVPGPGVDRVGRVGAGGCPLLSWCGPNLRYDAGALTAALGASSPGAGDLAALRALSTRPDDPARLMPGAGAAAEMSAGLAVTGRIVEAGEIGIAGATLAADEARIGGSLLGGADLEVAGAAAIGGDASFAGEISASDVAGFGRIASGSTVSLPALDAPNAVLAIADSAASAIAALTAECAADATRPGDDPCRQGLGAMEALSLAADGLDAETITAEELDTAAGTIRATGDAEFGRLAPFVRFNAAELRVESGATVYVGSCQGC
ncbi:MAG: hypothetical protein OXI87_05790 [Albidovulum sp.]|nr:hypothetical protein [Albidovulum sp.]MDE0533757.1 hypothetical protein [Albidovulum sp.]